MTLHRESALLQGSVNKKVTTHSFRRQSQSNATVQKFCSGNALIIAQNPEFNRQTEVDNASSQSDLRQLLSIAFGDAAYH